MLDKLHFRSLCVIALSLFCVATLAAERKTNNNSRYKIESLKQFAPIPAQPDLPDIDAYTLAATRAKTPTEFNGRTAHLVPISDLYFLPFSNRLEMQRGLWQSRGMTDPDCIVLGRGTYTLEQVYQQIKNDEILSRVLAQDGSRSYLLSRPLYIAATGALVMVAGDWLKLNVDLGAFITYNGALYVNDARISSWDTAAGDYGTRQPLPREQLLKYGVQKPRPYILGMEGSQTYIANSEIIGLGYKGSSGTFGLSFSSTVGKTGLGRYLATLAAPSGWLIGNRIENLFFGLYTKHAISMAIIGNEFYNNVIYAIDPHDYSSDLLIARNLAHGSQIAHGIIVSREVVFSHIIENLSLNNAGSGIMLDRNSGDNHISDNLTLTNEGDGIAVFESDDNHVYGNHIYRNSRNGIYVRNSSNTVIKQNQITANGASGIEVAVVNIDNLETRDFVLDPYRKNASAVVVENVFNDNANSAVTLKAVDNFTLSKNQYRASGPQYFAGDVETQAATLLRSERNSLAVRLRAQEPIAAARLTGAEPNNTALTDAEPIALDLLKRLAKQGTPRAMLALARHYAGAADDKSLRQSVVWYGRAVRHVRPSAMRQLGILLLTHSTFNQKQQDEGLIQLAMATLLGDVKARLDLQWIPDLLGLSPSQIAQARKQADRRLRRLRFWNATVFPQLKVSLTAEEARRVRKRALRMVAAYKRGRPLSDPHQSAAAIKAKADSRLAEHVARWDAANQKKVRRHDRLTQQQEYDAQAVGPRQAYLKRIAKRRQSAQHRRSQISPAEQAQILNQLQQKLALVNRHRSPAAQIRLDRLALPWLKQDAIMNTAQSSQNLKSITGD